MAEPFLGEIKILPYNFAPRGWAFCAGQILSIQQNTALFSLLGTQYGGNGINNFQLPNLQGAVAIHAGDGPGLTPYSNGESDGTENVTVLLSEMASHNHQAGCYNGVGDAYSGGNGIPAIDAGGNNLYTNSTNSSMQAAELSIAGDSEPHNNMQPFQVLNYCIALQGIFPSRN
jgi:microcystin-dependent protein